MKHNLRNARILPSKSARLPIKKTARNSIAYTLAIIITLSFLICTCIAYSLAKSINLPSAGTVAYTSTTEIVVQVSASHDDAGSWWDPGGYYRFWELERSHVSPGHFISGEYYDGGFRFTNVNIPQGATIISAVLKTCCDSTCDGTKARWNLYGQKAGDCNTFSTRDDFETRPTTTAQVDTGNLPPWVEGNWYETPDISTIIQEIVSSADWKAGNALAILIYGHPEAETTHEIRSYDADPNQATVLEITYEAA